MQSSVMARPTALPFRSALGDPTPLPVRWGQAPALPSGRKLGDGRPTSEGSGGSSILLPNSVALDIKPLLNPGFDSRKTVVVLPPGQPESVEDMDPADEEAQKVLDCDVEEEVEDEEVHEKPLASDVELNVAKFEHIWTARAPEGVITADRLPALLVAAEAPGTDADILLVIKRVLGSDYAPMDKAKYEQALEMYRRLVVPSEDSTNLALVDVKEMGRIERWAASLSDDRATNVLLSIVVGVSFTAAFLVAGLAILFMWIESFKTLGLQMLADLELMQDVLDVFNQEIYVGEVEARAQDISTLVAMVTDFVSYQAVLLTDQKNLVYMAAFLSQAIAAWWEYQPEQAYINIARVMAIWADQVMTAEGDQEAFDIASNIVDTLPPGYEVLLGQWTNASNTSFKYVTRLRYASECINQTCDGELDAAFSPMKAALQGMEGAMETLDYRPHPVFVGFSSIAGIGVEYKTDVETIDDSKYARVEEYFNLQNANALDSREFMIGRIDATGSYELLTKLRYCDDSCTKFALIPNGPLGLALQNQVGVLEAPGYTGEIVIAAYCPIPSTNLGLVVQMKKDDRIAEILTSVAAMLNNINANLLTGSEELELVVLTTTNGTQSLTHLTQYKFPQDCPPAGCANMTEYWAIPMKNCSSGTIQTTDYRGTKVYASYFCMPDFNAFLAMKVDDSQVDSDMMTYVLRFINERNSLDNGTSYEFLAAQAKDLTASPGSIKTYSDFKLLSAIKNPEACYRPDCSWDSNSILRALQNKPGDLPGLMDDVNYANRLVMAAMEFDANIGGGVGLVLEMDNTDFVAPILNTILIIMCFTLGVSVFSTFVLVLLTKKMMRSMITASLEGKRAVEKEKEQFAVLVASMYPKYVVPRLLAGERQIVGHVKHTAVFFSDIFEFTAASNTITSEELIQFMGYTYGVMDDIADRYGVYKVKTVGDAYLAIAGLPGVELGSGSKDCCLDMMKFASCVAQVFSHRFFHPDKGQIMTLVANTMPWNKRAKKGAASAHSKTTGSEPRNKATVAPTNSHVDSSSAWTGKNTTDAESTHQSVISGDSRAKAASIALRGKHSNVQCVMSYGVAAGPVTAGVLQGKSPMFDIWGKTVNLASRMETTGQPGRIQVSEHVFRKVAAVPGQPFAFEHGHKAYCKGFGAVNSYFVRSTSEPPPKDLMIQLGLEPRYGLFFFENVLTSMQRAGAGAGGPTAAAGVIGGGGSDTQSLTSSQGMNPPAAGAANAAGAPVMDVSDCDTV